MPQNLAWARQAAENGLSGSRSRSNASAGAEARVDSEAFAARLKSCPCYKALEISEWESFPQSVKHHIDLMDFIGTTEAMPCYKAIEIG
jgi:hypothetical protein